MVKFAAYSRKEYISLLAAKALQRSSCWSTSNPTGEPPNLNLEIESMDDDGTRSSVKYRQVCSEEVVVGVKY